MAEEIRNKDGNTPSNPCGWVCTRFDLEAWNQQAREELARARAQGADVSDLQTIELQSPITLPPWKDLRSAIDTSAGVAQQAFNRFRAKVEEQKPTPTPDPNNGGWTWPEWSWPSWPGGEFKWPTMPTLPDWIWYALLGVAALVLLEGKDRRR